MNAQETTILENNAPVKHITLDNAIPASGQICLANESRFASAYYSEPLTSYATGWKDSNNIEALLDFLFPPVQVGRRFEFKKFDNSECFYSDGDDQRSMGSDFKKVDYRGSSQNEKTINRGLTMSVDLDQVDQMPDWREAYTARLLQRLLRNELRRAITLVSAAATNTAKTWDTTAGKDPDQDILTELIAATDDSGLRPNRILFGDTAWNKRLLAHRAQATAGGYASAGLTPAELAAFLGLDGVRISRERYQSSGSAKSKVVPDIVLGFFAQENPAFDDPSNTKRFWSAVDGGGKYRVYEQQVNSKMVELTVEHYSTLVVTSTIGLRKLSIS